MLSNSSYTDDGANSRGKTGRLNALVLVLSILAIGAAVLPIALMLAHQLLPSRPPLSEVGEITGLAFTESTTLLNSYSPARFTAALYARVRMERSEARGFLDGLPAAEERSTTDIPEGFLRSRGAPSWWKPGSPRRFVYAVVESPRQKRVFLLLDLDDRRWATLYVRKYAD